MDIEVHPALQETVVEERPAARYEVHPSLQAELEVADPEKQTEVAQIDPEKEADHEHEEEAPVPEEPKQRQWRETRAKADEAKRLAYEREALERERDFYRQQALQAQAPKSQEEEYLTDTEKKLKREMDELKSHIARQSKESEEARRKAAISQAEYQLSKDYPDIKTVVSDENVQRLQEEYPHLYKAAVASSDIYEVGSAAYEFIMAKGIYKKPKTPLNQIVDSATRNQGKPRSVSTVSPQQGDTPIQKVASYMSNTISSDDEKKALWAEMVASSTNRR